MDMFPTTLSAMNVKIEGDRLGLGTDLFSGRETLIERDGYNKFNVSMSNYSKFYYEKMR
jgi:phosphoglycerol transferase